VTKLSLKKLTLSEKTDLTLDLTLDIPSVSLKVSELKSVN
jgi:hypothetical protein